MAIQLWSDVVSPSGAVIAAGSIPLSATMHSMASPFPAVDAVNGPMTADTHLVSGGTTFPAPAGKALFRWNSGVFRTQGMNCIAATAAANTSGQSACINASTSRFWTYGNNSGAPIESNSDYAFMTDSQTVQIVYWNNTAYVGASYHDVRCFIEDDTTMKSVRNASGSHLLPKTSTGTGFMSVTFTMLEARERQYRFMLPANCYFVGVYVDALATMRKAPNVLMTLQNGDSWQEPNGGTLANPIGGAYPTGTYRTVGLPQEISVLTGWVTGLVAQGGTGHFNVNDGVAHDDLFVNAANESVFTSESRTTDAINKFGSSYPLFISVGGWNDGDLAGSAAAAQPAYQAKVQAGINRLKTKRPGIQIIGVSIQPVSFNITTLDTTRDYSLLGQKAAYTDPQNAGNCLGFVDLRPMWPDTSMTGQRGANVNSSDNIHLTSKGNNLVSRYIVAAIRNFQIPLSYYTAMLAA